MEEKINEKVEDIRKADNNDLLNDLEVKSLRKYTGKFIWLAENCRPDIAYEALCLSKRQNSAMIADLKFINTVIKKIKSRTSTVM